VLSSLGRYLSRHHVGLLALFFALGGASFAAADRLLPRNSVGTRQLRKNAVVSAKVKDRSLLARDFKRGQLHAGPQGPMGGPGGTGQPGAQGPTGEPRYARTVVVSPVGTEAQNGAALRSALTSIGGTSPQEHYLVQVEPGFYDIGSIPLALRSNVDVQGSGMSNTMIRAKVDAADAGAVVAAPNAALRQITVTNVPDGTPAAAIGIYSDGAVNFTLDHVSASAIDASFNAGGYFVNTSGRVEHSDFGATGGNNAMGIFVTGPTSTPTFDDVTASAILGGSSYGVWGTNGTVVFQSARLNGATHSAYALNGGLMYFDGSQLAGGPAFKGSVASNTCALSYNGNFVPLNSSCL